MEHKLSNDEERTLEELNLYLTTVIDFFIEDSTKRAESKISIDSFYSDFKSVVDSAYKRKDINGLKMVAKDLKEMATGCNEDTRKALNKNLHQAGITIQTLF